MEIEFQGFYTRRDLIRAIFLANKPNLGKLLTRIGFGLLAVALYVAYIFISLNEEQTTTFEKVNFGRHLFSFGLILFYFIYPYISVFVTAYKMWKDPLMRVQYTGSISNSGIMYTGNKSAIAWERFAKKQIKPDLIVLLTANGILSFFPRGFFKSDADWQRVIQLINFKVVISK